VQERTHAHWFCEQKALDQIEPKLARSDKIGVGLYADRNGARAELTSDIDDVLAQPSFGAIVGAARDQFPVDFYFDEGKVPQFRESGAFTAEAIDRDRDLLQPGLFGK
jgi:hypothetical protein